MTGQKHTPLEELIVDALERDEADRQVFIDEATRDDPDLRHELMKRVSSCIEASGFFDNLAQNLGLPGAVLPTESAMSSDPSSLVGRDIAHYRVVDFIGGGGMGMVYKAEDQRLKRFAALKFLPASMGHDPQSKQRFLREAQAASALDHPNICTVFEIGDTNGQSFIAMAYYEGRTIAQLLERGPLDVDRAVELAIQMASGLAAAHAKGIVHRDMKPANVMVCADNSAKILDFGLAKSDDGAMMTAPGAVLGTAAYMSPEQAAGGDVDHRTDIWSLGAIIYEMLSGQRSFLGAYPQAIVYSILNIDPEPLSGLRPGLPLQLLQIVERAMAKKADTRYARVEDLKEDLLAVKNRQAARTEARHIVEDGEPATDLVPVPSVDVEEDVLHILCVDDEPELELLIQQRFRKRIRAGDWKFVFAIDGEDALTKLERHPEIGLILTDLNMPRMDGLTLLGKLAEMDRPLRTVVVSAYGDIEKIRTAMNRGAFDFVTKPIDFKDLDTTVQKAASDLETYRKALRSQQQLVSIQQEMDVARRIQDAIIPVDFPANERLEMYGFSAPAAEVSGTFYDAFDLDDGRVAVVMGDATGRGVTSALLMAMGQTFVKGFIQQGSKPADCLSSLNRMLFADGLPNVGLSLVAAVIDSDSGGVTIANAGHNAPFILRSDGTVDAAAVVGPRLWETPDATYENESVSLAAGDALVLNSRGLSETTNESGSSFTRERLAATLREVPDTRPTALIRSLVRSVRDFAGDNDPREDLTILATLRK